MLLEMHPLLVSNGTAPAWLAAASYAFWAGLPALLRWLLKIESNPS